MEIVGIIFAVIFFLAGFAGIFLPYLPDAPLVFLGALLYYFFAGFSTGSIWLIIVLLVLTVLVVLADFLAGLYGVKRLGGSIQAQIFSFIGGLVGLFVWNIPGLILGTLLGAILGELISGAKLQKSIKVGVASLLGFMGGVLFKVVVMVVMLGVFIFEIVF